MSGWFHLNRSISSVTHCQISSLWNQQGKSVLFYQPCAMVRLGCIDRKFSYQREPSGQYLFLHVKSFVRGQPTEACWSHLHLDVQECPCWDVTGAGIYHLQHQIPSRAFTGAGVCWKPVTDKVKHDLSCTDSPSLTIPVFLSSSGFLMYLLHLHMTTLECFFSFLNGNRHPAEGLHSGMSLHDDFWFTNLPFSPQTLSHGEMLLVVHAIISPTHQY